jgi:hypothetical protein
MKLCCHEGEPWKATSDKRNLAHRLQRKEIPEGKDREKGKSGTTLEIGPTVVERLPVAGAGRTFEGAGDIGGDPAAVEVSGLGDDAFAVYGAFVDAVGVEGDVVAEFGEIRGGLCVAPGRVGADGVGVGGEVEKGIEGEVDGVVGGEAFELAKAAAVRGGLEEVHGDVGVRNVVDGRVAGLEYAEGARGFGEEDAAVNDADVVVDELEARWARVVPYGFGGGRGGWGGHGVLLSAR